MSDSRRSREAKPAVGERQIRALVDRGLSTLQIAAELDRSQTAARHWLRTYGLSTAPAVRGRGGGGGGAESVRECPRHGPTVFRPVGAARTVRCVACTTQRVTERRRAVKEILVREAGGRCALCGYERYRGALQFHHRDPATKRFPIGGRGLTRSLAELRREAALCVLLCANCHAEVEGGIAQIPSPAARPASLGAHDPG